MHKFIKKFPYIGTLTKEEINALVDNTITVFNQYGYSTQVLKKYFISFMESDNFENYLERCIKLRNIKNGYTEEKCILKWGPTYGLYKWKEYCDKQAYTNSKEYKNMSDEEFLIYNKSRATTLENLIKKYGIEEGTIRFKSYCDRQAYTNTLEYFIEKHGNLIGKEKYENINFRKSHSLESYVAKYGDIIGLEKYKHYRENIKTSFYSQIGFELFSKIDTFFKNTLHMYYAPKTKEFGKFNKVLQSYTYFDCVFPEIKLCLEFNGDVFHANPKKFVKTDKPNPFNKSATAEQIWEFDKIKNNELINNGYDIIIIWESEYRKNPNSILKNIIELIQDKVKYYGVKNTCKL